MKDIDLEKLRADMVTSAKAAMEASGEEIVRTVDGYVEQRAAFYKVGLQAAIKTMVQAAIPFILEESMRLMPSAGAGFLDGGVIRDFGGTNGDHAIIKGLPKCPQ